MEKEKITPVAYRDFTDIVTYFEGLTYDTEDLSQEVQEVDELVKEIKHNAVQRVIDELERRESRYHNIADQELRDKLLYHKGYNLLDEYLFTLTQEAKHPISQDQVTNYVWELIAVDLAKYQRSQRNVLELWTNDKSYCRWMMLED